MAAKVKYVKVTELPELVASKVNFAHIALSYRRELMNAKRRTSKTKRIFEVRGSGRKLHRQKGTGMARQGERQNPHMRGGAKGHGPQPVHRTLKLNKKVRRSALHSVVKYHLDQGEISVIKSAEFEGYSRTADAYAALVRSGYAGRGVVVVPHEAAVWRALRNIAGITTRAPRSISLGDLIDANFVIFSERALTEFRDFLSGKAEAERFAEAEDRFTATELKVEAVEAADVEEAVDVDAGGGDDDE